MNIEEYEIINVPTIGRAILNNKTKKIYYSEFEIIEEKNKQIDQLTNNWNELEKWLEYEIYCNFNGMKTIAYKDCLDKMKEIKENKQ